MGALNSAEPFPMAYENAQNANNPGGGIPLGPRIEIFPTQPLPEFNGQGGAAYAARLKTDATSSLFALICQSNLPPRMEMITTMRNIDRPGLLRLVEAGTVAWPDGSHAYALVYQKPQAPRMMASVDEVRPILGDDVIHQHFVTPMIDTLVAMSNAGLIHNAIRPGNIFWRVGTPAAPQLGECLSAPAGLGQPVMFEPIERALAMPMGRGTGLHADDCYAFGVTLALLILGRNPFQGMDDAAIIDMKMQRGSFAALIGNQRLSPGHIEILRGLLTDDIRQRWSANDLDQWLGGRRMTTKSSDIGKRAGRHFDFAGKEYWQLSPLASALAANVAEATKIIESEQLYKWLRRAMNDDDRAADIEACVHDLKQGGKGLHYEDQLVARVAIALDNDAPIRYRGLSVLPSGMAAMLAEAAITGNHVSILSEIISSQLVSFWISMQKHGRAENILLAQAFDRMKTAVEKTSLGNGFERAVYESNASLPCLSPMLRSQYVISPKALLPALERVANSGNRPKEPIDRHIAAFLLVRDKRGESFFAGFASPENSPTRNLALITLFADLQTKHGPESLPGLAGWLAPFAEPVVRRFLSRALRDALQKQAREAISSGRLTLLLRLLDDQRRVERDRQDFLAARLLYLSTQKEIADLERKLNNRDAIVQASGKPMAASVSSFLAILLVCAAVLRALFVAFFL